jgi:hypothetical protein
MTEQSKEERLTGPDLLARALEKRGIKVQKVEPPKDFLRVILPRNPEGLADWSGTDRKNQDQEG